jgi:RNA polymerase sigma-70 factor, ECF subfamily
VPVDDQREELFKLHVVGELELLYRVALSLTHRPADAEDLVQDTLIRAYRSIDRFDGRYPRAWLLTILRNTNINRGRRQRPELLRDPSAHSDPPANERTDSSVDLMLDGAIADALQQLPEQFRQVIELVDVDGLSYQEAAVSLGIPSGTVMSRLHRGRERMRGLISPALFGAER